MIIDYENVFEEQVGGTCIYKTQIPVNYYYGYIYGIYNKELKKIVYIGQSRYFQLTQKRSFRKLNQYFGSGILIHRYIKKHGLENLIKFFIDCADSKEQLNLLEIKYIKEYNTIFPNGLNIAEGGNCIQKKGWHHTVEAKQRISITSKERWKNPEYRERVSNNIKNSPNSGKFNYNQIPWNKGKTKEMDSRLVHKEETKQKISKTMKIIRNQNKGVN